LSRIQPWQDTLSPLHLPQLDDIIARSAMTKQADFPIIELHGGPSSGKTHFLMFIAMVYALPYMFPVTFIRGTETDTALVEMGGRGQGVVYLDLDSQLDLSRLSSLIEHHFDRCIEMAGLRIERTHTDDTAGSQTGSLAPILLDHETVRREFVRETLNRILIVRVCYNFQLLLALRGLQDQLKRWTNVEPGALIVDPVNAFYWREKSEIAATRGDITVEMKASYKLFKKIATEWQLAVFASSRIWMKRRVPRQSDSPNINSQSGMISSASEASQTRANAVIAMDAWLGWWRDMPVTWRFLVEPLISPEVALSSSQTSTLSDTLDTDTPLRSTQSGRTSTKFRARLLDARGQLTEEQFEFEVAEDGVFG
jgi:hypothetical protein